MILTPHAVVGAALANIFPNNPEIGFSLALASHYVLDTIPHWEYKLDGFVDEKKDKVTSITKNFKLVFKPLLFIFSDFLLAIILSYLLFVRDRYSFYLTIGGVFFSVLPDFLQFVYLKFQNIFWIKVQKIHEIFHGENKYKNKIIKGNLTQIITVVIFLVIYWLY